MLFRSHTHTDTHTQTHTHRHTHRHTHTDTHTHRHTKLSDDKLIPSIQFLAASTASKRIQNNLLDSGIKFDEFKSSLDSSNDVINILEAAGSLHEGLLYGLSLSQLAKGLNAKVLLAHFWQDSRSVEALLEAKNQLGEYLGGVILNAVNPDQIKDIKENIVPSLKSLGLDVFGWHTI